MFGVNRTLPPAVSHRIEHAPVFAFALPPERHSRRSDFGPMALPSAHRFCAPIDFAHVMSFIRCIVLIDYSTLFIILSCLASSFSQLMPTWSIEVYAYSNVEYLRVRDMRGVR